MTDDTDGKTEELKDLFEEVTDETTVTEERREERGTLRDADEVRADLEALVAEAVEDLGVDTPLDEKDVVDVVEAYFAGDDDAAIADRIDAEPSTVREARVRLHLLREEDRDAPMDLDALRERLDDGASTAELAEAFDVDEETVRFYRRVVEAERAAGRAGDYRDRFAAVLQEEVGSDLTSSAQSDGLEGATEDMEVDVDV